MRYYFYKNRFSSGLFYYQKNNTTGFGVNQTLILDDRDATNFFIKTEL